MSLRGDAIDAIDVARVFAALLVERLNPMGGLSQTLRAGFDTARTFLQEAWSELRKVQWPSQKEVRAATLVVLILVGIVALFLFLVDAVLSWLLQISLGV